MKIIHQVIILVMVLMLCLVFIFLFLHLSNFSLDDSEENEFQNDVKIERDYSTPNEKKAIEIVENENMFAIFNGTHNFTTATPCDEVNYIWHKIIDNTVINYYLNLINDTQGQQVSITFTYIANSTNIQKINISHNTSSHQISINNRIYQYGSSSWIYETFDFGLGIINENRLPFGSDSIFTGNMTSFNTSFNISIENGYIINQYLYYEDYYAPTAGFWGDITQIVILDSNFNIILILNSGGPIGES